MIVEPLRIISWPLFIVGITDILIGFLIAVKKRGIEQIVFFLVCLFVGLWAFSTGIMAYGQNALSMQSAYLMIAWSGMPIPFVFLLFSYILPKKPSFLRISKLFMMSLPLIFFVFFAPAQSWIRYEILNQNKISIIMDWPATIYFVYYLIYFMWAWTILYSKLKMATGFQRMQYKYFMSGLFLTVLIGVICNIVMVVLFKSGKLVYYGPLSSIFLIGFTAYAIMRYQLMDIRVAVTRAGIFVVVYAFVLGLPFWLNYQLSGWGTWVIPFSILIILATCGPFLYNSLCRRAENIILRKSRKIQQALQEFAKATFQIKEVDELLKAIVRQVDNIIKPEFIEIYALSENDRGYRLKHSDVKKEILPFDRVIPANDIFIEEIKEKAKPIFFAELSETIKDRESIPHDTAIMPFFADIGLFGFLVLGPKKDKTAFSGEDFNVFELLSHHASLALENAILIQERALQEAERQHMSKMSILGDLASGVSHNMNNRFNSMLTLVNCYFEMYGHKKEDIKEMAPEEWEKRYDDLIWTLKNLGLESERGFAIAKAMQDSAREPLDPQPFVLEHVVELALNLFRGKKDFKLITVMEDYEKNGPRIWGSTSHIQDVAYNLMDNACDAILEKMRRIGKGEIKEEHYKGRIIIKAKYFKDEARIEIEDNGIGIEEKHLESVGQPCFSTKAAKKEGTGFGVSTIKKLLRLNHGRLEIKSIWRVGSVFAFTLPLATPEQIAEYQERQKKSGKNH